MVGWCAVGGAGAVREADGRVEDYRAGSRTKDLVIGKFGNCVIETLTVSTLLFKITQLLNYTITQSLYGDSANHDHRDGPDRRLAGTCPAQEEVRRKDRRVRSRGNAGTGPKARGDG